MSSISNLHAEHRAGSIGIGQARPRLSWRVVDADAGVSQVAATVELRSAGIERSVTIEGADSVLVAWPFDDLRSRDRVEVRVTATLDDGTDTGWSEWLPIEAGLLSRDDWRSDWVAASVSAPAEGVRPTHLLRAEIDLPSHRSARIYATAHGIYELSVNGARVGDELLSPGWTSYAHRLRYQTYDVGTQFVEGRNVIAVELSDGWYRGRIGFHGGIWDNYGTDLSLLLQLEVVTEEGELVVVPLADAWRTRVGASRASLYDGETFDARAVPSGWTSAGLDDTDWATPAVLPFDAFDAALEAPVGPPVRVTEELEPVTIERMPSGRIRLDFGQNIAGLVRLRLDVPAGRTIRLHHAEVLEAGELATRPLRSAPSVDAWISDGSGLTEWTPRFTVHGFRYAEIEGWDDTLPGGAATALVIHSDMERAGWFSSSHAALDRLHENVVWSMRDNFVDLPTDCPQRDERLGWTGDIQVFAPTAAFLYSSTGVLQSWLRDVTVEQRASGSVPNFVPWIACGFPEAPSAAWGDAAVIVPWTIYERLGDEGILADQYESMKAWVDQVTALSAESGLWNQGFQLGDWLDPAAPPEDPGESKTDRYLVSSAYQVHSARLFARAAGVLGRTAVADEYSARAEATAAAFRREFVTANGRIVSDTVTAISLCLVFDLLGPDQRERAGRRLVELVADGDYRIQTGFVGTPLVCDALAAVGAVDEAYHLLLQDELPSWLYPVSMGATTVWERWDSMLPSGEVNPGEMTSFNHYALGAVADFMHRVVAGIAPAAPGYRRILIEPRPGGGLSHASATHETPYGKASVAWRRIGSELAVTVVVPTGASAVVRLPDRDDVELGSGSHELSAVVRPVEQDPPRPVKWNPHGNQNEVAA